MKVMILVEVTIHDEDSRTESTQQIHEFILQEIIDGKRKSSSKFNKGRMTYRVIAR